MVAHRKSRYITPEEYLELERDAETRHEYEAGDIIAMSGASPAHDRIKSELSRHLGNQLAGKACELFSNDVRVWVPGLNRYYYPDASVACDPQFQVIKDMASLLNPTVIFEVLSPSTESQDRGRKWQSYQTLPSLKSYIMVAQDRPYIETLTRQQDNAWVYIPLVGLDSILKLPNIDCEIKLADIYARVTFPPEETQTS